MGDEEVFAESNVAGLVGSWQARQDHGEIDGIDGIMARSMRYVVLKPDCEIGCCLGAPTASRIIVKRSLTRMGTPLAVPLYSQSQGDVSQ